MFEYSKISVCFVLGVCSLVGGMPTDDEAAVVDSDVENSFAQRAWPEFPALTTAHVDGLRTALENVVPDAKLPSLVRLGFHDCAGGCDGCLDFDAPANGGLEPTVKLLDTLYRTVYQHQMSRADFWAWSALLAVEKTTINNNKACQEDDCRMPDLNFTYKWGRKDCRTSPRTAKGGNLPGATFKHSQTMEYFAAEFGLNERETIALMGAHTLGGAHKGNSGYSGNWVKGDETRLNNNYYKNLVETNTVWKQRAVTPTEKGKHWQLESEKGFLLLADIGLYKEVFPSSVDGRGVCEVGGNLACAPTSSADIVELYATDKDIWLQDFSAVMQRVVENKWSALNGAQRSVDLTPVTEEETEP